MNKTSSSLKAQEAALLLLVLSEPGRGPQECVCLCLPQEENLLLIIHSVGSIIKSRGWAVPQSAVVQATPGFQCAHTFVLG